MSETYKLYNIWESTDVFRFRPRIRWLFWREPICIIYVLQIKRIQEVGAAGSWERTKFRWKKASAYEVSKSNKMRQLPELDSAADVGIQYGLR